MTINRQDRLIHQFTGGRNSMSTAGIAVGAAAAGVVLSSFIFHQRGSASMSDCNIEESRCERHVGDNREDRNRSFYGHDGASKKVLRPEVLSTSAVDTATATRSVQRPSWVRRNLLVPIGVVSLPVPRVLTKDDPALKLPVRVIKQRQRDEQRVLQLLEREGPILQQQSQQQQQQQQEKFKAVADKLFQLTYGKGVTPQIREDFLIRYGCTGWTDGVISRLLDLAGLRGIVEMGAGHGQWSRALNEAYNKTMSQTSAERGGGRGDDQDNNSTVNRDHHHHSRRKSKMFDFVLAYDDNSNLPLNIHIYNQYTQPHRDYFGHVKKLPPPPSSSSPSSHDSSYDAMKKVLQSWQCRGRVLLLVYPPPGPMAAQVLKSYVDVAPENDTVVFVGEGRGGANADDTFFDMLEAGDWILVDVVAVLRPPGDKGHEKMFILQRNLPSTQ